MLPVCLRRLMAIALSVSFFSACQGDADFSDVMPEPVILNAELYQQEITDLDRLVFEEQPLGEARRASLASKLEELAKRVKGSSDSRFLAIEALELRRLAAVARRLPPDAPPDAFRNQWMRIRNNLFDDRSWFARSAADLEAAPPTVTKGPDVSTRAAEPSVSPPPLAGPARHGLDGRWGVKEIHGNGRPISDAEMSGAVWVFEGDQLSIQGPAAPTGRYKFTKIRDDRGAALFLESQPPISGRAENGWMIYELTGGELKLAFYDGLGDRPEGFAPPSGRSEPMFIVVRLLPAR